MCVLVLKQLELRKDMTLKELKHLVDKAIETFEEDTDVYIDCFETLVIKHNKGGPKVRRIDVNNPEDTYLEP